MKDACSTSASRIPSEPMRRSTPLFSLLLVLACPMHAAAPNIVFILADDMGYGDIAGYGAPDIRTPHLDRLAAEGVRFTQFYGGGPECTPSRTAFLTGRYPERVGGMECAIGVGNVGRYDHAINLANRNDLGLPPAKAVLAPALKHAGYTNAIIGKWHMGYESGFNPLEQGFDTFWGFLGGFVDYFRHRELSDLHVLYRNRDPIEAEGYMTRLITDQSIDFIQRNHDRPFFLYAAYSAPHFPFQGPGDESEKMPDTWAEVLAGTRETYVEMMGEFDAEIGRLLQALEDTGVARRTIVVFMSDHGAMPPGRNLPFSNWKTTLFEGGLRVPAIVRWPGRIKAGTISHQPGWIMDFTASFLRAAGAAVPHGMPLDGMDILRHVERGQADHDRTFFWRFRREDVTWWGIRDGDLKYIRRQDAGEVDEWHFNLAADPAELHNLVSDRSHDAARFRRMLDRWEAEVHTTRGRN